MKIEIKSILSITAKLLLIFVIGILSATVLMFLSTIISASAIAENAHESLDLLSQEGVYHRLFTGASFSTQLDNFTDTLMIKESIAYNESLSVMENAMVLGYSRYWHGFLVFLRPALLFFNLSGIRILNLIIQTALVILVCVFMLKKCKRLVIPYLLSLIFINPIIISQSLQYSSVYYIFNIAMLIMLIKYEKLNINNRFCYMFLIIGMCTSFLDLLTYPIATLCMPLILLMFLRSGEKQTVKENILFILKICVCWALGYFGLWFAKWVIASIVANQNLIISAMNQASIRLDGLGGDTGNVSALSMRMAALFNMRILFTNRFNLMLSIFVVVALILVVVICRKKFKFNISKLLSYIIIALIPIVWFTILCNHSYVHQFFTHRALIGSIFACLTWFVSCFEDKKILNESEVKKQEFDLNKKKIAVLIPCYNEHLTIKKVIETYREALPTADIYVYDNNSKDNSDKLAKEAGAIVRYEKQQGKGYVVRSMFNDIDADCYFMVDADDTYMADNAQKMCDMVLSGEADMVIGDRLNSTYMTEEKRKSHTFGNKLVRFLINTLYKNKITDIMTGQRAFSKRFVKTFECKSNGFEIETEMTIFACDNKMVVKEVPVLYKDRPEGSFSKLNTYIDGIKVLKTIFKMYAKEHPMKFFGLLSLPFLAVGIGFMFPILVSLAWMKKVATALIVFASIGFGLFAIFNIIGLVAKLFKNRKILKTK